MKIFCDVILATFFGEIIVMTSLSWRHDWFFEVRFRYNWPNHVTLGQQYWRLRGTGGEEPAALGDFLNFLLKNAFYYISVKIQPRNMKHFDWGRAPWSHPCLHLWMSVTTAAVLFENIFILFCSIFFFLCMNALVTVNRAAKYS